jgi:hypothetical protein
MKFPNLKNWGKFPKNIVNKTQKILIKTKVTQLVSIFF